MAFSNGQEDDENDDPYYVFMWKHSDEKRRPTTPFQTPLLQTAIRVKLGASEEGSGLLLINHLTEPGVHILADQNGTSLTLTEEAEESK